MARPPLPIGTGGEIRYQGSRGGWRARCKFRDYDGITRDVERSGKTKQQARDRLRTALRDRSRVDSSTEITPDTLVSALVDAWWVEFGEKKRAESTRQLYRDRLDRQFIPSLGALRIREMTTSRCERFLKVVKEKHGASTAKTVKSMLTGILGLATRHNALDHNPARDTAAITVTKKAPRALTLDQARDLRGKLAADGRAIELDLPDFTDMMLGTGMRISEAAGVVKDAVDLKDMTVEVRGQVERVKGKGLRIKPEPKSDAGYRTLELPSWLVTILRRRMIGLGPDDPIFPSPSKSARTELNPQGLRDRSNTAADLREAFDRADYPWVTSHTYRRTVATLMDKAGLSARAAADQLGHEKVSMVQDNYFGREVRATGAATVLEQIADVS